MPRHPKNPPRNTRAALSTHRPPPRLPSVLPQRRGTITKTWPRVASVLGLVTLLSGCSHISEVHYFKSKTGNPPNFYRLRITGSSFLSSSRYVSGYFDEQAVNNYFGEFSQPTNGQFGSPATNTQQIVPIDGGAQEGTILLLLLSANSDAIADQIGAIAKSTDTANLIGGLLDRKSVV